MPHRIKRKRSFYPPFFTMHQNYVTIRDALFVHLFPTKNLRYGISGGGDIGTTRINQ